MVFLVSSKDRGCLASSVRIGLLGWSVTPDPVLTDKTNSKINVCARRTTSSTGAGACPRAPIHALVTLRMRREGRGERQAQEQEQGKGGLVREGRAQKEEEEQGREGHQEEQQQEGQGETIGIQRQEAGTQRQEEGLQGLSQDLGM